MITLTGLVDLLHSIRNFDENAKIEMKVCVLNEADMSSFVDDVIINDINEWLNSDLISSWRKSQTHMFIRLTLNGGVFCNKNVIRG